MIIILIGIILTTINYDHAYHHYWDHNHHYHLFHQSIIIGMESNESHQWQKLVAWRVFSS